MMKISVAYRFRLITNVRQEKIFSQWAGSCRFLYNLALEQRCLVWGQQRKGLSYSDQCKDIPLLKKELEWLKLTPAQCLQQSLKDLDRGFTNFFRKIAAYPIFKRRGKKDSFRFPDSKQFSIESYSQTKGVIKLPKIGRLKFFKSQEITGEIKHAIILRDGAHWFISFNCEKEIEVPENQGRPLGIDRGITKTIALSDESDYENHDLQLPNEKIKKIERKISYLQMTSRKQIKFSESWKKTKKTINKKYKKIRNIRHDFLHKITTKLAKNHSFIVLEDLKIKNMSASAKGTVENPGRNVKAKSGLNRSILRQGWFKFQNFLSYKTKWYGSYLELVNAQYTSQTCS